MRVNGAYTKGCSSERWPYLDWEVAAVVVVVVRGGGVLFQLGRER